MFTYKYTSRDTLNAKNLQRKNTLINLLKSFNTMGIVSKDMIWSFERTLYYIDKAKSIESMEEPSDIYDPYIDWSDRELKYFEKALAKQPKKQKFKLIPYEYNR